MEERNTISLLFIQSLLRSGIDIDVRKYYREITNYSIKRSALDDAKDPSKFRDFENSAQWKAIR